MIKNLLFWFIFCAIQLLAIIIGVMYSIIKSNKRDEIDLTDNEDCDIMDKMDK